MRSQRGLLGFCPDDLVDNSAERGAIATDGKICEEKNGCVREVDVFLPQLNKIYVFIICFTDIRNLKINIIT